MKVYEVLYGSPCDGMSCQIIFATKELAEAYLKAKGFIYYEIITYKTDDVNVRIYNDVWLHPEDCKVEDYWWGVDQASIVEFEVYEYIDESIIEYDNYLKDKS